MPLLEHLIPDMGEHLTRWRETLMHHAGEIERRLDGIREAVEDRQTTPTTMGRHLTDEGTVAVGGNDIAFRLTPPPGYDWSLSLVTSVAAGASGLALYLDVIAPQALLFVIGDAEFQSEILPDIPIPSGSTLIAHFYDQTAGTNCSIHLVLKSEGGGMGAGA